MLGVIMGGAATPAVYVVAMQATDLPGAVPRIAAWPRNRLPTIPSRARPGEVSRRRIIRLLNHPDTSAAVVVDTPVAMATPAAVDIRTAGPTRSSPGGVGIVWRRATFRFLQRSRHRRAARVDASGGPPATISLPKPIV